jgi:hypothetical protein
MTTNSKAALAVAVCLAVVFSGCGSSDKGGGGPDPALYVTTTTLPQGVVNFPYGTTLVATGGSPPYAWNVSLGSLPPGMSLGRDGVLSGTPTASANIAFTVAVADSYQPPSIANGQFNLVINSPLQFTTPSLPNGSQGVFYSATLVAQGGLPPYSWMVTQAERFAEGLWPLADHSLSGAVKMFTLSVFDATGAVTRVVSFRPFVPAIWYPFRCQSG